MSRLRGTYTPPPAVVATANEPAKKRSMFSFGRSKKAEPPTATAQGQAAANSVTTTAIADDAASSAVSIAESSPSSVTHQQSIPPLPTPSLDPSPTLIAANRDAPPPPRGLQADDNFEYDEEDEDGCEILVGAYLSSIVVPGPLLAKKTGDKLSAKTHPSYEVMMMMEMQMAVWC